MIKTTTAAFAALAAGVLAAPASAQMIPVNLEETLTVVNFDLTANAMSPSFTFDLNGDRIDDFIVEIQFGTDIFGTGEELGISINEFATVRALQIESPNLFAGVFVDERGDIQEERFLPIREQFATIFEEGDLVGAILEDDVIQEPNFSALLYAEGIDNFDDGAAFSVGPFGEDGTRGFLGLAVTDQFEDTSFGFAEITRGSITLGDVGVQTIPGAPAPIPVSAVPVPPALGMLAGALALFGFVARRRKMA